MPAIRNLGGGDLYLVDRPWTKAMTPRVHLIAPLLEAQRYITRVHSAERGNPDYDLATFRQGGLAWGVSLGALQAVWAGIDPDDINWTAPWLDVEPDLSFSGRVVIARSPRYNNHAFPWRQVVEFYGDQLVFIGLPEEYHSFCHSFGEVAYHPTKDLLEVATVIKGSELFIGNQSSPYNIAEGLKHPRILEVALAAPDCCYGGGLFQYVADGAVTLFNHKSWERLDIPTWKPEVELDTSITPQGGWLYNMPNGDRVKGMTFAQALKMIKQAFQNLGIDPPESLGDRLIRQTNERLPLVGQPSWYFSHLANCNRIQELCPRITKTTRNTPR
jgi:hypothetical protein